MRRIIQANIDRLKELMKTETDPTKRAMEARLLAEEEAKKQQLLPYDKNETKAYYFSGALSICANASAVCRRAF